MVVVFRSLLRELLAGVGESLDDCGFAGAGVAHDHDAMPHHDGLHKLDDLCDEFFWLLVVLQLELVLDCALEGAVVDVGDL